MEKKLNPEEYRADYVKKQKEQKPPLPRLTPSEAQEWNRIKSHGPEAIIKPRAAGLFALYVKSAPIFYIREPMLRKLEIKGRLRSEGSTYYQIPE